MYDTVYQNGCFVKESAKMLLLQYIEALGGLL